MPINIRNILHLFGVFNSSVPKEIANLDTHYFKILNARWSAEEVSLFIIHTSPGVTILNVIVKMNSYQVQALF